MALVKVKITGIKWDTDGKKVKLPKDMTVEVEREDGDDDETVFDAAIDKASDETGWCISGIGGNEIVT